MTAIPPCAPCGPLPTTSSDTARAAGQVEFAGVAGPGVMILPIVSSSQIIFTPVDLSGTALEPSSTDFDMPAAGVLRYIGDAPKRFKITYALSGSWEPGPPGGPITRAVMVSALLVNSAPGSVWVNQLNNTQEVNFRLSAHHGEDVRVLEPGDELGVGLLLSSDQVTTPIDQTFLVFSMSLSAIEV